MNRKIFSLIAAVAFAGACTESPVAVEEQAPQFARSDAAAAAQAGAETIVALAGATDALSTLVFALTTSDANCGTDFVTLLDTNKRQYTVFAPTNDAFDTLIADLGADVVLSCDVLPNVLAYHVTRGRHTSKSVLNVNSFRMLNGERAVIDGATIQGAPLNLGLIDFSASNGVVHVVDAVLLPPSITN